MDKLPANHKGLLKQPDLMTVWKPVVKRWEARQLKPAPEPTALPVQAHADAWIPAADTLVDITPEPAAGGDAAEEGASLSEQEEEEEEEEEEEGPLDTAVDGKADDDADQGSAGEGDGGGGASKTMADWPPRPKPDVSAEQREASEKMLEVYR